MVRRVRGGSQACLVQGSDHKLYVAKFTGNPQGTRTLINEWFAAKLLQKSGVSTPHQVVLRLDPESLNEAPCFDFGDKKVPVTAGLHLGSLCPVDPDQQAIFDFLPEKLMARTANLTDFAKMIVIDTFLGQADSRQAIFIRDRSQRELSLRAYMIDHGQAFGGSNWQFSDFKEQSLYFNRTIYSLMGTASVCDKMLEALAALTKDDLFEMAHDIPCEWFRPADFEPFAQLLGLLHRRKDRLHTLVRNRLDLLNVTGSEPCHLPEGVACGNVSMYPLSANA